MNFTSLKKTIRGSLPLLIVAVLTQACGERRGITSAPQQETTPTAPPTRFYTPTHVPRLKPNTTPMPTERPGQNQAEKQSLLPTPAHNPTQTAPTQNPTPTHNPTQRTPSQNPTQRTPSQYPTPTQIPKPNSSQTPSSSTNSLTVVDVLDGEWIKNSLAYSIDQPQIDWTNPQQLIRSIEAISNIDIVYNNFRSYVGKIPLAHLNSFLPATLNRYTEMLQNLLKLILSTPRGYMNRFGYQYFVISDSLTVMGSQYTAGEKNNYFLSGPFGNSHSELIPFLTRIIYPFGSSMAHTDFGDTAALLAKMRKDYNIEIKFRDYGFYFNSTYIEDINKNEVYYLRRAVYWFYQELNRYTPNFIINALKLRTVVFGKNLSEKNGVTAGLSDMNNSRIFIDIQNHQRDQIHSAHVAQHEIFHLIQFAALYSPGYQYPNLIGNWISLNPNRTIYGSPNMSADWKTYPALRRPGFISVYSLTNWEEDMSEIYANLMVDAPSEDDRIKSIIRLDYYLNNKVNFIYNLMNSNFPFAFKKWNGIPNPPKCPQ